MNEVSRSPYRQNHEDTGHQKTVTNVYFLSGLGADERAFARLTLDKKFNVHFIKWITPSRHETLHSYAEKLMAQIDTTQPFQLVGLSFGGIMATVISDLVPPRQIILISSIATSQPLSKFYQNLIKVTLWHPLTAPVLKSANKFTYRYFGAQTEEEKQLLKQILAETDTKFLKWALVQMSAWNREEQAAHVYQLHGTDDNLIVPSRVQPSVWIDGGGHLMVYSHAEQLSSIINRQLSQAYE